MCRPIWICIHLSLIQMSQASMSLYLILIREKFLIHNVIYHPIWFLPDIHDVLSLWCMLKSQNSDIKVPALVSTQFDEGT